ncbi:ATPase [Leptospira ognonensis]|uniref:ATPase n=1 Tax=Leptospira ognonensis TaxID=2484945 RepID=A0A4R9JXQ5_9LEPT|nr:SRPBCC domain-containing protein [Leptospira ognonensis]TGL56257.1 ATPase [Leptospira ognonensis]
MRIPTENERKNTEAKHSTFTIERIITASKERSFSTWANADSKRRWFACHDDWKIVEFNLEFRIGGSESNLVLTPSGRRHVFDAHYYVIIINVFIIYSFSMYVNDIRISVSLVTVVFESHVESRNKMTFTEQIVLLKVLDKVNFSLEKEVRGRVECTKAGFDRLDKVLNEGSE